MAIPGQQDTALRRFEDELYAELCRQHDRVDLFVTSKADEIARRLQFLSTRIHQTILRCSTSTRPHASQKRLRRFAKYEQALVQCGDDIEALERFVNVQTVAFRKILKKYRKWTGSSALGSRFRGNVLSHPKSFTKRDFSQLQALHGDLLATLRAATPTQSTRLTSPPAPGTPVSYRQSEAESSETVVEAVTPETAPPKHTPPVRYWNEYDYGSEAGDMDQTDGAYVIYVNSDDKSGFPGMQALISAIGNPVGKMKSWFSGVAPGRPWLSERAPLLPRHTNSNGTNEGSYFESPPGAHNNETDEDAEATPILERRGSYGYASSSEEFPSGYEAHYASLPSIEEQKMIRRKEQVLLWGAAGSLATAIALLGVAAVLIETGRHRLRAEVDAGVILGVVASLGCAATGLGMTFMRQDPLSWPQRMVIWLAFVIVCVLNGVLLVLVAGNTPVPSP